MEYALEPDIKRPLKNPLASDQVVRTMVPSKAIEPSMIELEGVFYKKITALEQKDK